MKKNFYSELSYLLGLVILALGTALMERADFGMSMVVAPAYIIHLKLSQYFPVFSFGMAEYCLQLVLIVALCIALRKFKVGYLFSFVTAVLYGVVLDVLMLGIAHIPAESYAVRTVLFVCGMGLCSLGVALFLKTYLAPEAYELVVKEISRKYNLRISVVKTVYDLTSLGVSVIMSFCFFGWFCFEGVKWGTLITSLVNGWLIGRITAFLDKRYCFKDLLGFRKYLEK